MRAACVNQDSGIGPAREKGAAVHLRAMREAFAALGVSSAAIDESRGADVRARLDQAWREGPLDLIYERYALGKISAAEFAFDKRVPLIVEVNSPLATESQLFRGRPESDDDRRRDRFLFGRAAAVVAVSREVAAYAVGRGADPAKVRVFPNGVDPARFAPRRAADTLREELVPRGSFALGFHGRLRPWHGFDLLVRGTERLLSRGVPVHLVVVGKGDFGAELEGVVPARHYSLVGWQPHERIGGYVATFDALPLTYSSEMPFYFSPLKLPEAMACGVVPVVPDLGDLSRIVGGGGLVYRPDDLEGLVSALEQLVRNSDMRERLSQRARDISAGYSWERVAEFVVRCAVAGRAGRSRDVRSA